MNEAIQNTDASVIDDANVDALITLKDTDGSGSDITFDATIDATKKIITIVPTADFAYLQDVYVALAPVEDALGNESTLQTATFTTIANNDATLSDLTIDGVTVSGFDPATYTSDLQHLHQDRFLLLQQKTILMQMLWLTKLQTLMEQKQKEQQLLL